KSQYPEEMTIVLQHQFWDLKVGEEGFSVGLSFDKTPERLVVPYSALVGFFDPSVQFGLQFVPGGEEAPEVAQDVFKAPVASTETKSEPGDEDHSGEVVSLDAFRKDH
ncbi:MAG TPA: hypothetical protein EYO33_10470, partial [Phycisphaerales bacterium]|nr:hypothetical protein [Phycisphaerales bacterium]